MTEFVLVLDRVVDLAISGRRRATIRSVEIQGAVAPCQDVQRLTGELLMHLELLSVQTVRLPGACCRCQRAFPGGLGLHLARMG